MQYFNSVHAHKPKFGIFFLFVFAITRSQLFFLPFSFPFTRAFYSRYIFRCIFFLASVKSSVLIMAKAQKWILVSYRPIISIVDHFTTIFEPKLITSFFNFVAVRMLSISKIDCCTESSILALSPAYQLGTSGNI